MQFVMPSFIQEHLNSTYAPNPNNKKITFNSEHAQLIALNKRKYTPITAN